MSCFEVTQRDNRLPGAAIADRVSIDLGETIHRVQARIRIGNPGDVVGVVVLQVADTDSLRPLEAAAISYASILLPSVTDFEP